MSNRRSFHLTTIDCQGSPTSGHVVVDHVSEVYDALNERIKRGLIPDQTWYRPVIAAYIFDTSEEALAQFVVDGDKYEIVPKRKGSKRG